MVITKRNLLLVALPVILIFALNQCETANTDAGETDMSTSTGPVATKTTGAHFDGAEDHSISRFDADEMIDAFQADNPFTTYGWYFGREAIERLLARPGAVGIRIYGGRNPDGSFSPVGVAVDSKGIPLFDTLKKTMDGGPDDGIMDRTDPCPPDC